MGGWGGGERDDETRSETQSGFQVREEERRGDSEKPL